MSLTMETEVAATAPAEVIRVLIVDDIASTRENLQKLLAFEDDIAVIATAGNGREGVEAARELSPHVVLMDVNMPVMDGIEATETLAVEAPQCPVVIMSVQGERDYLRRAMQSGARAFLIKPFSGDELLTSIRRVHELEGKKGTYLRQLAPTSAGSSATPAGVAVAARSRTAEVHLVMAGKGGCGKSLLATNLATALRLEVAGRVCLVDLDLQFGDVGVLLNLPHGRTVSDLVDNAQSLDGEFVDEVLADGPEGLRVLVAPLSPELGDLVRAEHVRAIFEILSREFEHIVVDSGGPFAEPTLEAVDLADHVLVIGSLNIPAIKNTKLLLKTLDSLKVPGDRVLVVVNHHDAHAAYDRASIEDTLRSPVAMELPSDPKLVGASVHRAVPVVVGSPDSEVSRRIRALARRLAPAAAGAASDEARRPSGARRFGFRR
ncbi:MAG TPA: response regulator [Candidatus Micrarchaeia archaeon]|nr:response regulator [Candidatus Micrarchaeia archaeon]